MDTRSSDVLISDSILKFFTKKKNFKNWDILYELLLKTSQINKFGALRISHAILPYLFDGADGILLEQKIPFFKPEHYYIIGLILKDIYQLKECEMCNGLYRRNVNEGFKHLSVNGCYKTLELIRETPTASIYPHFKM